MTGPVSRPVARSSRSVTGRRRVVVATIQLELPEEADLVLGLVEQHTLRMLQEEMQDMLQDQVVEEVVEVLQAQEVPVVPVS